MENTQTEAQRMKTEKHGTCSKVLTYLEFPKERRENEAEAKCKEIMT